MSFEFKAGDIVSVPWYGDREFELTVRDNLP